MNIMPLYAGLDMHTSTTTGTIKDEKGNPYRVLKVKTSEEGMKQLFRKIKKKQLKIVFEASRNWPYYASLLKPYSDNIIMAHPLKVRAIASARIKTDTIDSNTLSDLLRANLIPESYMPSENIVKLKELLRYRAKLSRMRATLKTKVRYVLSKEGKTCQFTDITSRQAQLWVNNTKLSNHNRKELDYYVVLIQSLKDEIKLLDKQIEKEQYKYPETEILKSVIGVNTFSALMIIAEVGCFMRFDNPAKLAAYAGIVPSVYQSSNISYTGNITKQGSRWLRWILTQCTHASIKSKKSHKLKRFYIRISKRRGKQKAITATAHKMLTVIWYLINKNEYYQY